MEVILNVNYVKIFYLAMAKFADKHFTKQQGWWFGLCIKLAIFARATMALLIRTDHPFGSNLSLVSEPVDFADLTGFHPLANVVDSTLASRIELFFFCFCTFCAAAGFDGT